MGGNLSVNGTTLVASSGSHQNLSLGTRLFKSDGSPIGAITALLAGANGYTITAAQSAVNNGDEILYDVKCSQALEDMIIKYGGVPVMWKTGHSLIKQRMAELNCKLGGEMSGHIFFADDYYGFDDALYSSVKLVELLDKQSKKLSDIVDQFPKVFNIWIRDIFIFYFLSIGHSFSTTKIND